MTRARGVAGDLALVVVSAGLYGAALPPLEWRVLPWVALVPLLIAVARVSPSRAALYGMVWGVALAAATAWWLPGMIARYAERPMWVGCVGLLLVGIGHAGIAYAPAMAWVAWATRRGVASPLGVAVVWSLAELLRTELLGDPWALAGYTQVRSRLVVQIADLGGVYVVGLLVVAVNATLAGVWVPALRSQHPTRATFCVVAALVVTLGYGVWGTRAPGSALRTVQVGVVQSGIGRGLRWVDEYREIGVDEHLGPSRDLRAAGAELLIWPEHAVSFYVQEPSPPRDRLLAGLRGLETDVVFGGPHYALGAGTSRVYTNAVFLFGDGGLAERYDKRYLLPLAETHATPPYVSGVGPTVLRAGAAMVGPLVCFEAMFPRLVRTAVAAGAEVLVNVTNDSWFGAEAAVRHHLDIARMRAIEVRRPVVRAAATGISAVIDATGRVVAQTALDQPATLLVAVEPQPRRTGYAVWGDWPVLAVTAFVLASALRRAR